MFDDVTAFVLSGGMSTRMGTDKALVMFESRTLLERALEVARSVTSEVRVAGNPVKYASFAPCVEDFYPNCGPLAGIHAALHSSHTEFNLMVAVDLPFVTAQLLEFIVARAQDAATASVTVPRVGSRFQPLCAVYRREFVVPATQALRVGHYKIDSLFETKRTQIIEENELVAAGFSPSLFRNVNTPGDLAEAKGKAGR